ncbi:hypothetical protein TRVA0_015S00628 [Trichomonascus vanleenenianus]|uniref:uncharacterized protein n=1 Tax=Trichomonascus vanleenenianus TaxID=2268995 RepID=UPI003ECA067E
MLMSQQFPHPSSHLYSMPSAGVSTVHAAASASQQQSSASSSSSQAYFESIQSQSSHPQAPASGVSGVVGRGGGGGEEVQSSRPQSTTEISDSSKKGGPGSNASSSSQQQVSNLSSPQLLFEMSQSSHSEFQRQHAQRPQIPPPAIGHHYQSHQQVQYPFQHYDFYTLSHGSHQRPPHEMRSSPRTQFPSQGITASSYPLVHPQSQEVVHRPPIQQHSDFSFMDQLASDPTTGNTTPIPAPTHDDSFVFQPPQFQAYHQHHYQHMASGSNMPMATFQSANAPFYFNKRKDAMLDPDVVHPTEKRPRLESYEPSSTSIGGPHQHHPPTGDVQRSDSVSSASGKRPMQRSTAWTRIEEDRLQVLVDAGVKWSEITREFPNRSAGAIKKHYYADMKHTVWTEEEDAMLQQVVKEDDENRWRRISEKVGKPAKACERRIRDINRTNRLQQQGLQKQQQELQRQHQAAEYAAAQHHQHQLSDMSQDLAPEDLSAGLSEMQQPQAHNHPE